MISPCARMVPANCAGNLLGLRRCPVPPPCGCGQCVPIRPKCLATSLAVFSFLANGHHRAYLTISAVKSIAAIFLFAPFWLPLSACIFEKAVGVMLVHVHGNALGHLMRFSCCGVGWQRRLRRQRGATSTLPQVPIRVAQPCSICPLPQAIEQRDVPPLPHRFQSCDTQRQTVSRYHVTPPARRGQGAPKMCARWDGRGLGQPVGCRPCPHRGAMVRPC
jgi:hypothetical protein